MDLDTQRRTKEPFRTYIQPWTEKVDDNFIIHLHNVPIFTISISNIVSYLTFFVFLFRKLKLVGNNFKMI